MPAPVTVAAELVFLLHASAENGTHLHTTRRVERVGGQQLMDLWQLVLAYIAQN
jgi:hypothetical protein